MNQDQDFAEVHFSQRTPGGFYLFDGSGVATSQLINRTVNRDGRTQWNVCAYGERSNGKPRMAAVLNPPRYVYPVTPQCAGRRVQAAVRKVAG